MSPVHVGTSMFHSWKSIEYPAGWTDTFIFRMSTDAGLPPDAYAEGVKILTWQLKKLHHGKASVWIQLDGLGRWYAREVRRYLRGASISIAVTSSGVDQPAVDDFWPPPPTTGVPGPPPPQAEEWFLDNLTNNELACLRVLDRLQAGYTAEIAALAGLSLDTARKNLHILVEREYATYIVDGNVDGILEAKHKRKSKPNLKPKQLVFIGEKSIGRVDPEKKKCYPFYEITRKGNSIALRSWGMPPGCYLPQRWEFREPPDSRHRKISRNWPAWLKKAWPHAQVWTGWSEVYIKGLDATPDALAWGSFGDYETLFWLEVESGHQSSERIIQKINRRLNQASAYGKSMKLQVVFVLLAMPWVQKMAGPALVNIQDHVAVVTEDWNNFGHLPMAEWGRVRLGTW
jgi:hypothetical protein